MITRAQARELGLSHAQIQKRLSAGSWEIFLSRVFHAVQVPLTWHARLLAACLWGGPDSAISHRSAAALWSLDGFDHELVEMTTARCHQGRPGLVVHRSAFLPSSHVARVGPIRVTTVHRTLVDIGAVASPDLVEQALECALRRRITTEARLQSCLHQIRSRGRKGPAVLQSLLSTRGFGAAPTESSLETETLQTLRRHGLPEPDRQHVVCDDRGFVARVDLAYLNEKIVIEVDSRSHHLRQEEWERDLARRNELTSQRWSVFHATKKKISQSASSFVACIKRARCERRHVGDP